MPRSTKFPADLASAVARKWDHIVAGDYVVPDCPPPRILRHILETSYLASCAAEEGRYPQFNVVVSPKSGEHREKGIGRFRFGQPRSLEVSEFRRLAPASDLRKSAIWTEFDDNAAQIVGLIDLGTTWHRAKLGFGYRYNVPGNLIVQVDRPGRLRVYQGQYQVASLVDGNLTVTSGLEIQTFMSEAVENGLGKIVSNFHFPKIEEPRDFQNFWYIAHWNVIAAIVNSISIAGHGGMLIIVDSDVSDSARCLRLKYSGKADIVQTAFIDFINRRNQVADYYEEAERKQEKVSREVFEAELLLIQAADHLTEAIRFVAQLAGCDGAIVISDELSLIGFGAEVRAEMKENIDSVEVITEHPSKYKVCDVEQFGMRHRAAVKFASQGEGTVTLAVSQDGPISAVWRKGQRVYVKKGVALVNLNMPFG